MVKNILFVALGGAVGSVGRYLVSIGILAVYAGLQIAK